MVWQNGWREKKTWGFVVAFVATAVIIVFPWMHRNFLTFHSWELSAVPYYNIFVWHGGSILAVEKGISFGEAQLITSGELAKQGYGVSDSLFAKEFMIREGMKIIKEHPVSFVKLDSYNSWKFFTMDGYYDMAKHLGFYQTGDSSLTFLDFKNSLAKIPRLLISDPMFFLFIGGRLLWILLLPVFLIGVYLSLRHKENRARDALLLLMIFYFMAASLTTGFGMNARFRMPVSAFYIAYITLALMSVKTIREKVESFLSASPPA